MQDSIYLYSRGDRLGNICLLLFMRFTIKASNPRENPQEIIGGLRVSTL
jgi:hypothetical protein